MPWKCWRCGEVADGHLEACPRCGSAPERNRSDLIDHFCYVAARRWGDLWAVIVVALTGVMGFGYFESVVSRGSFQTVDFFQSLWWCLFPGVLGLFLFRLRHAFTILILFSHAMICLYLTLVGIYALSEGLTDHATAITGVAVLQMTFPFVFGPIGIWMVWMAEKLQVTVL